MRLLDRLRGGEQQRYTIDDYAGWLNDFSYGGSSYGLSASNGVSQTMQGSPVEGIPNSLAGYAQAMRTNGVVFACMLARMQVFSSTRFQFQQFHHGRPGTLFGTPALTLLEEPWVGGTTQDLLTRMIQDADLAGNCYLTLGPGDEVVRLRPDWMTLVLQQRYGASGPLGYRRVGYAYEEDGPAGDTITWLEPKDVVHFAPLPDPMATYRGMSWLTPIIREAQTDDQMNRHKQKFFENAATPNMVITLDATIDFDKFKRFKEEFEVGHKGVDNAYKTLFLGAGGTPTVVGKDFKQIDLKSIQGHGETRIAAAAGVPPIIVGLSEGLEAATYSNYGQARRRYADGTIHPLWQNAAGSLTRICPPPLGSRLWYDSRDVPFLREDEKDAAQIQLTRTQSVRTLIDAGYDPQSVTTAVDANDFSMLKHSGLYSVQLQPPGTQLTSTTQAALPAPTKEAP